MLTIVIQTMSCNGLLQLRVSQVLFACFTALHHVAYASYGLWAGDYGSKMCGLQPQRKINTDGRDMHEETFTTTFKMRKLKQKKEEQYYNILANCAQQ